MGRRQVVSDEQAVPGGQLDGTAGKGLFSILRTFGHYSIRRIRIDLGVGAAKTWSVETIDTAGRSSVLFKNAGYPATVSDESVNLVDFDIVLGRDETLRIITTGAVDPVAKVWASET